MLRRFLNLFRPNRLEADIREEIEFHRAQSSGRFGNAMLIADHMRDASTIGWLETAWQDVRYGYRQLRKTPVLVAVALLSLALGIGANTAVFTLISAVMLQSLPVQDPAQLVLFNDDYSTGVYSGNGFPHDLFSYPSFQYFQAHNDSFADLCAFRQGNDRVVLHVTGASENGPQERAKVRLVSGNYFQALGVKAAAGRLLNPADDGTAAARVAVLSYQFWQDRFHLDAAVVGQTVVINGTAFTVAGVADRSFFGERMEAAPDFWLPLSFQPQVLKGDSWLTARDVYWLNFIGRLRPGTTRERAQAAVNLRLHQFYLEQAGAHPSAETRRKIQGSNISLKAGGSGISGLRFLYAQPLHVLMAVVALVLLIACANIATLLLARASARRQEFLARLALGASRGRLLRQVLTEAVLLSVLGGCLGALFAWWSVKLLVLFLQVDPVVHIAPNLAVLGFTFLLSLLTGVLFGIFPALQYSGLEIRAQSVARSAGWGRTRLSSTRALITMQVALSLILLLGAGLLAHSLLALERQNIGFSRDRVLLVRTDASLAGYQTKELFPLYRQIDERLNQLPGVVSAAVARFTPESGSDVSGDFSMEGQALSSGHNLSTHSVSVGPHFFETLGIPLRLGRTIGARDTPASAAVAVVNQTFVKRYLPQRNPLGQHIMLGTPFAAPGMEIVGVVGDAKYYDLRDQPQPMVFPSLWQSPDYAVELIVHTSVAPSQVTAEVRRALGQISGKLPVLDVETLDRQVENSLRQQKMITSLCSLFSLIALILASIGIYGALAYAVAGRAAEIGLRMAIGAQRRSVIWLVLHESVMLIAAGILLGLPFALSGTRWLKSFLFGVPAVDPLALGGAVALILTLALLAGYLPARRAALIDPMQALRHE